MKLYFSPGACSLSPHIILREAGAKFELEQVDNREKKTKSGQDYWAINPKGQVPVLELDSGERLTEGPIIVQYIADQKPGSGLAPPAGTMERYRVQEWLNFTTSELHKTFGPIFRPTTPDAYKTISKENLGKRFDWTLLEGVRTRVPFMLSGGLDAGNVAEALRITRAPAVDVSSGVERVLGEKDPVKIRAFIQAARVEMDLSKWPNLKAYVDRVAARPKVQEAMKAEGLIAA